MPRGVGSASRGAIRSVLGDDQALVEHIFAIVEKQREY
jgi:hypothetical protein